MPRQLAGCSETLKRYDEALQRFIEALSNLTRSWSAALRPKTVNNVSVTAASGLRHRDLNDL